MKYAFYPGCSLDSTGIQYRLSTEEVARIMEVDLWEIPSWSCCGASSAHSTNELLALALPARNLALAEKEGLDVAVPCAACYSRMKATEKAVRACDEVKQTISKVIEMEYGATNNTISLLDVFTNKVGYNHVAAFVEKPLKNLKVACYYGCLMVKPPRLAEFDDPEDPQSMDRLMEVLGAEPVAWSAKSECCGAGFASSRTDIVLKMSYDILRLAKNAGAEAIATACPLCMLNLDMRQKAIEAKNNVTFNLPIMYFTELMALAFGCDPKKVGFNKHFVDAMPLAKKLQTATAGEVKS
jgi:heterodisulfide reductase subunit B